MTPTLQATTFGPVQDLRPRGSHTRSKKNPGKRPHKGG